jgi:hypothetical protein
MSNEKICWFLHPVLWVRHRYYVWKWNRTKYPQEYLRSIGEEAVRIFEGRRL